MYRHIARVEFDFMQSVLKRPERDSHVAANGPLLPIEAHIDEIVLNVEIVTPAPLVRKRTGRLRPEKLAEVQKTKKNDTANRHCTQNPPVSARSFHCAPPEENCSAIEMRDSVTDEFHSGKESRY